VVKLFDMRMFSIVGVAGIVFVQIIVISFVMHARRHISGKLKNAVNYLLLAAIFFLMNCSLNLIRKVFLMDSLCS